MAYAIEPEPEAEGRATQLLATFGLAVFAISFPLVRILVDAPEFFIAHEVSPRGTVLFFVALVLGVPAALALAASLPGRVGRAMRTVVVAGLALGGAAAILQPMSGISGPFVLAVIISAIWFTVAERRHPAVRTTCASLSVLALLLLAWAVGPSRVGSYVRSSEAVAVEQAVSEPLDAPVVVIVLDEVSLVHLLDDELGINAERFPHLAALADTSHWFRAASSVSPQTSASVPALLSGIEPDLAKVPVSSAYPTNLFLQLGRSYDVGAYEPITSLCPRTVCDGDAGDPPGEAAPHTPASSPSSGVRAVIDDVVLVYRHAVGSEAMRASLPSISQGWAGFGAATANVGLAEADGRDSVEAEGYGTFPAQARVLHELIDHAEPGDPPPLRVAHLIAPHMPWVAMPDGATYDAGDPAGLSAQGGTLTWSDDEAARREGYQRYQFQLGALDRELGELRARLTERGMWDDALVVVTADHGVQFDAGGSRAVGAGGVEVTSVPFFLKEPGQTEGTVDDRAVLTIDLVPTLLGRLGIRSPSTFDGLDVFAARVPAERSDAFIVGAGSAITPDQTLDALRAAVERRSRWLDPSTGWDAVHQIGVERPMVGAGLDALGAPGPEAGTWRRAADEVGALVTAELDVPGAATAALVCAGTVAAAAPVAVTTVRLYAAAHHCPDPETAEIWTLDATGVPHPARRLP